mgnify:CR=1 FL=1
MRELFPSPATKEQNLAEVLCLVKGNMSEAVLIEQIKEKTAFKVKILRFGLEPRRPLSNKQLYSHKMSTDRRKVIIRSC